MVQLTRLLEVFVTPTRHQATSPPKIPTAPTELLKTDENRCDLGATFSDSTHSSVNSIGYIHKTLAPSECSVFFRAVHINQLYCAGVVLLGSRDYPEQIITGFEFTFNFFLCYYLRSYIASQVRIFSVPGMTMVMFYFRGCNCLVH